MNEILPSAGSRRYHVSVAGDLTKTVEEFYAAIARRDYAALREMLDPRIEWNSAENFLYADKNPYVGLDVVLGALGRIDEEWEVFAMTPEEILVAADTVIVRGRYRGKLKDVGFGLDAEFVHVLRYSGNKLLHAQTYTDTAQFRDAVNQMRELPPTMTMS
jgi:ketosteroid isomerase-like protein